MNYINETENLIIDRKKLQEIREELNDKLEASFLMLEGKKASCWRPRLLGMLATIDFILDECPHLLITYADTVREYDLKLMKPKRANFLKRLFKGK